MISADTIVALSSAAGAAPRAIVRLSGPSAKTLAIQIVDVIPEKPAAHRRCQYRLGEFSFWGNIYRFDGPASYTGEDIVEFHIPG
ncbi:MAG TPA: hypothetical protein VG722_00470, partial [Tepidisphaeraceae bacterium]|nr:hypothetical protein [Tepidisphaeraceae bacterium]